MCNTWNIVQHGLSLISLSHLDVLFRIAKIMSNLIFFVCRRCQGCVGNISFLER